VPPPRLRLTAIQVVVALLIGTLGVLVPRPHVVEQAAMATETRHLSARQAVPTTTTAPAPTSTPPATDEPAPTTTSTPTASTAPTTPPSTDPVPTTAPPAPEPAPGRVTVTEDTRRFRLFGVTLDRAPSAPVRVRTAVDGGDWGPWQNLEFDIERALPAVPGAPVPREPDEEKPGTHSEPVWVDEADRYELDLPADAEAGAEVHLVYETTKHIVVANTEPAGADPGRPSIQPRSAWGARAPKETPTIASSLKLAIVHHTAGTNAYSAADVPALLRGIQAFHMDANGWNDIAYNFAVDRFGRIWEARAGGVTQAVVGAHSRGFNTGSTGVVVLGNFQTASPTSAAVSAVARVLSWKLALHDADPRAAVGFRAGEGSPRYPPGTVVRLNRIVGHRDVGLTACPGVNLYAHLGTIRARAKAAYPSMAASGVALVGNFAGSGADDVFLRQPGVRGDQLLAGSTTSFRNVAAYSVQGTRYRPAVGDFDGNGVDDIFWYGPGSVPDSIWLSRGDGRFVHVAQSVQGTYAPVVGDVDGDGDDDILWYAAGRAPDSLWLAQGGGRFGHRATANVLAALRPVAGDFDGDGDDDIFWHGPGKVGDSLWVASGGGFTHHAARQVLGSYRPAAGDFDGDGDDDIMWYAPGSPPESVWLADRLSFQSAAVPSVRGLYAYVRAGDFDGDGRDELLWYASPGSDAIWWHASPSRLFGRSLATVPALR